MTSMGWGTFIAGRTLSAARREATAATRKNSADFAASQRAEQTRWINRVLTETVLGHPQVEGTVDNDHWGREIARMFDRQSNCFYGVVIGTWIVGIAVAFVAFDPDSVSVAQVLIGLVTTLVLSMIFGMVAESRLELRHLYRIDKGFQESGWPVEKLRHEMALAQSLQDSDKTDLFPPPG